MNSSCPFVSVIIPTHNRRAVLSRTLRALSAQNYPADRMEVLLVADGCTDDTVGYARQYLAPWKLQVLEQPGLGPSTARNRGATQASGEVLIFLDDDMEVVGDFVSAHVEIQKTHPQTVAVGILHSPLPPHNYFTRSLQDWWEGKFFRLRQVGYRFQYDDFFGGNFSVQADFFTHVGGFNTELRCHEDYELGVRLLKAGAICRVTIDAVATHYDVTDLSRALQRRIAEGKADIYLAQKYTGLHKQMLLAQAPYTVLGRILRYLAFRQPFLGNVIAQIGQRLLPWLEWLWLFGFWQALFYHLQDYWYWYGVGTVAGPDTIRKMFLAVDMETPDTIIDLAPGITVAEHHLDMIRPTSARIFMGLQWVGDISNVPGMERLRGEHLRRILAMEMPAQLAVALALAALMPDEKDEEVKKAWQLPAESQKIIDRDLEAYNIGPKKVVQIELSNSIPDIDITGYDGLHALVRAQGQPLGCVTLIRQAEPWISARTLHEAITKDLGYLAISWSFGMFRSACTNWPPVSVVVCTRNRTSQLAECLQALFNLDYPQYEILVIDNAPANDQTAQLVDSLPVRYVREDRPGLDWARNCGLKEASHSIVAFTDDDARPDRGWLRAIAQTFDDPEVTAVTGLVLPIQLDSQAQNLFEFGYGGMQHGFQRRIVRRINLNDTQLLWASSFGVGANMAFRKTLFAEIGGFDVALDVGTPSGGGGDVEMFHRLVAKGYTLVYEPAALVWHQHRPEMADLKKLVINNGRSFGCYLLTSVRRRTVSPINILYFAVRYWLWDWIGKRLLAPRSRSFPRRLVWQELLAALGSPITYMRSQAYARRSARRNGETITGEYMITEKVTG